MNKCESHHEDATQVKIPPVNNVQHEYSHSDVSVDLLKEKSSKDSKTSNNTSENNKKASHRCTHSFGPPPRPFKKARYAWEIKNYDYTLKKMTQDLPCGQNQTPAFKNINAVDISKVNEHEISNYQKDLDQTISPTKLQEGRTPEMHMIGPPHQGFNLNPLLANTYNSHYGAVFGNSLNQTAFGHDERINPFHNQIPHDPDARLIRWHTRQLCRSIFDNTVNRMLENMGFSPVTERSQALHPLLVLSLSDDEERESEEAAHQRTLESQALSAALHQKGFLPPPYHYDNLESATTSDYDSSEEDSEIGEGTQDELTDHAPLIASNQQQGNDEECYVNLNSQHHNPSLAHLVNSPVPYLSHHNAISTVNPSLLETNRQHFNPAQNLCDYPNDCDDTDSNIRSTDYIDPIKELPKLNKSQEMTNQECIIGNEANNVNGLRRCQSLECSIKQTESENSLEDKQLHVDDNENCIASHKQKTLIEGKVEKLIDNCHNQALDLDGSKINENSNNNNNSNKNNNNNSDSSYFMKNAIHLAIKQQGLGFQRA
ncbi:UNVERIFIED_CONTAM: hypothetical protein RMT77_016788 [Armadillidium vulgare]